MKPGWKTTEFWVSVGSALVGLGISLGLITPEQGTTVNQGIAQTAAGVAQVIGGIMVVASGIGYAISRGLAKLKKS